MPDDCGYRLTAYEPIVESLMRCEYRADGWELTVRHRHYGGRFGECPPALYSDLTLTELEDVLAASMATWGPTHTPRVDGRR